jgi:hypothetical protein
MGPEVAVAPTTADAPGAASWDVVCLNCGERLTGRFCTQCGQRAVPPHPTIRQLAGDAWDELAGWDGRLARTVRTLIRHPGQLTRALLEGQRARYVSPVRLYLTCSLVYFVLAAAVPQRLDEADFEVGFGVSVGAGPGEETAEEAAFSRAVTRGLLTLPPEERAAAEREIAAQPALLQPMMRAMAVDYRALQRRIVGTLPRALFLLIPALAAILALFHRRRPYPDHLYFAIHLQSFVFITLCGVAIAEASGSIIAIAAAQLGAGLCIAAYAFVAQRRVYGGSWVTTVLKTAGIGVTYVTLWVLTSLIVTLWVSRGV